MLRKTALVGLICCAIFAGHNNNASAALLETSVAEGTLSGMDQNGTAAYLGVPYALAPVGDMRWKPPAAAASWAGVKKANQFSAICPQNPPAPFAPWTAEYIPTQPISEDCLYLNIWTPAKTTGEKLPVFVWIHGGGLVSGAGSTASVNGAGLAEQGVVVVTINYRLGLFGFLAHPELSRENAGRASGNYGFLDQIAALQWVKRNIAAFGGDASRVTIGGQSSGGASVHYLAASPLAKGLFRGAVAQSSVDAGFKAQTLDAAERVGKSLQDAAGAANIKALRQLSTDQLRVAAKDLHFDVVVDGQFIVTNNIAGTIYNDTPMLTGLTANEYTTSGGYGSSTPDKLSTQISGKFGAAAPRLQASYHGKSDEQANAAFEALWGDFGLASFDFWVERRYSASQKPIYAYLWNHTEPGPRSSFFKAFHNSEIPYIFKTFSASPERPFTDEDRVLSDRVSGYWVNFIKSGNPNGDGLAKWPAFTAKEKLLLQLDAKMTPRPVLGEPALGLFSQYFQAGGAPGF